VTRWAASGAMALTGRVDAPCGPPERLVDGVERLGRALGSSSGSGLDALALLGERAALMGLWRRGAVSCGGSCRLLPTAGGDHVAVSLPRREDLEAVAAWLELDDVPATTPATWSAVAAHLAGRDLEPLLARAQLLGLPVARVGEVQTGEGDGDGDGVVRHVLGPAAPRAVTGVRVVDLSALWAGPLCGDLLAGAGAAVVKVESAARPDGARRGAAPFFDLLNARKRSVALDFARAEGRRALRSLVAWADVVIEASRPRALEQLGIVASDAVRSGGPQVWVSVTGYGRDQEAAGRVAFGDDAAAAGGLVVWADGSPLFCADAVADPLTGLTAAHACLAALAEGGRWVLDVSMAGVAAGLGGPTLPAAPGLSVAEPRARTPVGRAPALGADTAAVLAEVGAEVGADVRPG
jgi:hypothetical protein